MLSCERDSAIDAILFGGEASSSGYRTTLIIAYENLLLLSTNQIDGFMSGSEQWETN